MKPTDICTWTSHIGALKFANMKKLLWKLADEYECEVEILDHDKHILREDIRFKFTGPRAYLSQVVAAIDSVAQQYNDPNNKTPHLVDIPPLVRLPATQSTQVPTKKPYAAYANLETLNVPVKTTSTKAVEIIKPTLNQLSLGDTVVAKLGDEMAQGVVIQISHNIKNDMPGVDFMTANGGRWCYVEQIEKTVKTNVDISQYQVSGLEKELKEETGDTLLAGFAYNKERGWYDPSETPTPTITATTSSTPKAKM